MGTAELMMMFHIALLIVLPLFFFLGWLYSMKARHKEKLMMIEKGLNPNDGKDIDNQKRVFRQIAIVLIGTSLGVSLIALFSIHIHAIGVHNTAASIAILLFSIGVSLLVANRFGSKNQS